MSNSVRLTVLAFILLITNEARGIPREFNPIKKAVKSGKILIKTRLFAKLPPYSASSGKRNGILAMVPLNGDLYVTTGVSGGIVYRVKPDGSVTRWFNVAAVMALKGHPMSADNEIHGGIRSIAFHPDFKSNGKFYISAMEKRPRNSADYVYFSDTKLPVSADSVVLEFTYSHQQKKVLIDSYRHVIRIGLFKYDHPIKDITFMGKNLLIGHGDGSVQSAIVGGGQNNDGLGKILRINPLQNGRSPYSIPKDNPFVNNSLWKDEIFAVGFRNPHTICVSQHGIFVADAGRDNVEEVNIVKGGKNYGWELREGTFKHLPIGGIGKGIEPLPRDDAKYHLTYPNVQLGHTAGFGSTFVGQAIAGGCPVDTDSELKGLYLYSDFPIGKMYYSNVAEMKNAVVEGNPSSLTQATVYLAKISYDHDRNPKTPPKILNTALDVLHVDGARKAIRADVRFGRGSRGELYWSTKTTGQIYEITNSK